MSTLDFRSMKALVVGPLMGLSALVAIPAHAQTAGEAEATVKVTDADRAAVQKAASVRPHAKPLKQSDGSPARLVVQGSVHKWDTSVGSISARSWPFFT